MFIWTNYGQIKNYELCRRYFTFWSTFTFTTNIFYTEWILLAAVAIGLIYINEHFLLFRLLLYENSIFHLQVMILIGLYESKKEKERVNRIKKNVRLVARENGSLMDNPSVFGFVFKESNSCLFVPLVMADRGSIVKEKLQSNIIHLLFSSQWLGRFVFNIFHCHLTKITHQGLICVCVQYYWYLLDYDGDYGWLLWWEWEWARMNKFKNKFILFLLFSFNQKKFNQTVKNNLLFHTDSI